MHIENSLKNDKKMELKNKKIKLNLTQSKFQKFIKPFFSDVDVNLINFLENRKKIVFKKRKNEFELNLLVSSLKVNKSKSENFINSLQKENVNFNLKSKTYEIMENSISHKITSLVEIDENEKEKIEILLRKQSLVNKHNKEEVLKFLDKKIPILAHKKMELFYDAQIINRFKSYCTFRGKEIKECVKPMILKGLIIEKLEYLNLFESIENNICLLKEFIKMDLKENDSFEDENIEKIFI